jgi:gas vesicle protein
MIVTIITGIIGCVCGNIAVFLFLPQIRKAKNIENEAKQSEEWKKLYVEAHQELSEKGKKIDCLYEEISKHRDESVKNGVEKAKLEVEITKLTLLKCTRPNCSNRQPPTGF